MENYIVRFKTDLKFQQSNRKKLLNYIENKISLIELIINNNPQLITKLIIDDIDINFIKSPMIYSIEEAKKNLERIINQKNLNKELLKKEIEKLKSYYTVQKEYADFLKKQILTTQEIINAFENDKIKDSINNMELLYQQLNYTTLTIDEMNKIIGMTISFNTQYAKKNKKHNIENIDIINALSYYYNQDGTFKYNEDVKNYQSLIQSLFINKNENEKLYEKMMKALTTYNTNDFVNLLNKSNNTLKHNKEVTKPEKENETIENYKIDIEIINALQELRKYYKNGEIINIPENIEEFIINLNKANLDEQEKNYILNLINEKKSSEKTTIINKYLNEEEQEIYKESINLLDSFNYSNSDSYILKQYIEELQTILNMLITETNQDDLEYLQNEIPNIINELSIICNKYTIQNNESTNKFIFLLNKNNIPYISEDINSIDQSYRKSIYSLIQKIDKQNQSSFRKILFNEELIYNMYEVGNQRIHISFVEIDSGIYVIIGTNIIRHGYKEFNQRLKTNQSIIKKYEEIVKNPKTRNEILKNNEIYLPIISDSKNITKINKLTLTK